MFRRAVLSAAIVLCALILAPAAGAQYQPGQPGLVLTPSTTTVGTEVTTLGYGCPKNTRVEIRLNDTLVATTTSLNDDKGSFEARFIAPSPPGQYTVTALCGTTLMSSILTVVAAPVTTRAVNTVLPATGSDSTLPMSRIGLGLIALGGLLVLAVRRRGEA